MSKNNGEILDGREERIMGERREREGKEERWKVLLSQIEIVWVFILPLMFDAIENHALDGCPGIEKEGRFQRRKAMGRYRL